MKQTRSLSEFRCLSVKILIIFKGDDLRGDDSKVLVFDIGQGLIHFCVFQCNPLISHTHFICTCT